MSYDLAVFDPVAAPATRDEFEEWYDRQEECENPRGCYAPDICSAPLKAWYLDMLKQFPAVNGPYPATGDSPALSEYNVREHFIYVAFGWSMVESAYEACFRLAAKHGLGFFDVSGDEGAVWLPDGNGGLAVAHTHS